MVLQEHALGPRMSWDIDLCDMHILAIFEPPDKGCLAHTQTRQKKIRLTSYNSQFLCLLITNLQEGRGGGSEKEESFNYFVLCLVIENDRIFYFFSQIALKIKRIACCNVIKPDRMPVSIFFFCLTWFCLFHLHLQISISKVLEWRNNFYLKLFMWFYLFYHEILIYLCDHRYMSISSTEKILWFTIM